MNPKDLPFPFPCLRTSFNNKGPGRNKSSGKYKRLPGEPGKFDYTNTRHVRMHSKLAEGEIR